MVVDRVPRSGYLGQKGTPVFRGIANVNLIAPDMDRAVAWYTDVMGAEPYFVRPDSGTPQYAEWRFGDDEDELALMDASFRPVPPGPGSVLVHLHADDVRSELDRLTSLGATEYDPVIERGEGWFTASVVDPFGNLIGLIQSPHWASRHSDH